MTAYTLTEDRFEHKAGTIVYDFHGCNYGCVSNDERMSGIAHVAVTLNADHTGPFFTVPKASLKEPNHDNRTKARPAGSDADGDSCFG